MAILRTVEIWPGVGLPDEPWVPDLDVDALARTAGGVCELISRAVADLRLVAPASTVRAFVRADPAPAAEFTVTVVTQRAEGFEMAFWVPPAGFRNLPWDRRRRTVLEAAHACLVALAPHRGWNVARLVEVRDRLADSDLVLRWASPWKAAPDRRHQARVRFQMREDGFGDAVVEIATRPDGDLVAASLPLLGYCSLPGWVRAASTLGWSDAGQVSVVPYVDSLGRSRGSVSLSPDAGIAVLSTRENIVAKGTTHAGAAPVVVRPHPNEAPGPRIIVVGGGPMNGVPRAYDDELHRLLGALKSDAWLAWWKGADRDVLELWYDFDPTDRGPAVRRTRDKVKATIRRPVSDLQLEEDLVALARHDVEALVEAIRKRAELTPPPALPLNGRRPAADRGGTTR